MATDPQTLLEEANCYNCYSTNPYSLGLLRLALLAQIAQSTATPQELLAEASCYRCYGDSYVLRLMKLALLDQLVANPAQNFISRAGITDAAQIAAIETLVANAQAHDWWDKCDCIYPFVGGNATAHAQNLKSSSFTIAWSGTVTHDANGITGNGTTGYGNTGYIPSSSGQFALNSAHTGVYRRIAGNGGNYISCTSGAAGSWQFRRGGLSTGITAVANDATTYNVTTGSTGGWFTLSRIDAAGKHVYALGIDNSQVAASTGVDTLALFILALDNAGVASGFSTVNLAGATIGSGLTFAEHTLMAADWQTFQTSLGRQV